MEHSVYEAFQEFCRMPTWDSFHPIDRKRFEESLSLVVRDPAFSPEAMGEYIRAHHVEPIWPLAADKLHQVISRLVARAAEAQRRS